MTDDHKSEEVMNIARQNGWAAEIMTDLTEFNRTKKVNDVVWNLYAIRGLEILKASWIGDRFDQANYAYGDHRRKLWWPVEVTRLLAGRPDPRKYRSKDSDYIQSYEAIMEGRHVPWDEDAPASEIMQAVARREIRWIRKFDGQVCSAFVDVNLKEKGSAMHFRVSEHRNGRTLEWADSLGFHTVALNQIIDVA